MNRLQKYIQEQQKILPPRSVRDRLHTDVMDAVTAIENIRTRKSLKLALVIGTALVIGLVTFLLTDFDTRKQPDQWIVESIIITDSHTAIWLEPFNHRMERENED
jgi:hypothetical protein